MITVNCEIYKCLGLFIFLFALPLPVRAEYLIRAPQASRADYEAALHEFSHLKSLVSLGSPTAPSSSQKQKLLHTLESAQMAFLSDTVDAAKEQFQSVVEMSLKADWDQASRQAIAYAHFRLAQLSSKPEERRELVRKALVVQQDDEIDATTFPPPLVALVKEQKGALDRSALSWEPYRSFRGFDLVSINGRSMVVTPGAKMQVWPGAYRVTALSNSHRSYSEVAQAQNLPDLRLERPALASGTCESPAWTSTPLRKDAVVFYGEGCLREFTDKGFKEYMPKLDLRVLAVQKEETAQSLPQTLPPEPEPRWFQNKWLWIGAAAVATGIAISIVQNRTSSTTVIPVHTETSQ